MFLSFEIKHCGGSVNRCLIIKIYRSLKLILVLLTKTTHAWNLPFNHNDLLCFSKIQVCQKSCWCFVWVFLHTRAHVKFYWECAKWCSSKLLEFFILSDRKFAWCNRSWCTKLRVVSVIWPKFFVQQVSVSRDMGRRASSSSSPSKSHPPHKILA